jgi:short-subunit dehydrogenase
VGLSESLHAELSPRGISVSAICPGVIATNIVATSRMRGDLAERQDRVVRLYERFGASPDLVAEAVVDAIRHRKIIRTVPRWQVMPGWLLRRISPRLGQIPARIVHRLGRRVT